jgi:hypothetical protein
MFHPNDEQMKKVKAIQGEFRTWRSKRRKSNALPARLWQEAVRLLDELPTSYVAGALRLRHGALKDKARELKPLPPSTISEEKPFAPDFLPISVEEISGCNGRNALLEKAEIIIRRPDGTEMTIRGVTLAAQSLPGLVTGFLGGA